MSDLHHELLTPFVRQLWSMQVQRSAEGAALHKPLLMLVALSVLERGTDARRTLRFDELEGDFRRLWPMYGGRSSAPDPALPFFHLSREPFWKLDGVPETQNSPPAISVLRSAGVAAQIQPSPLFELLLPGTPDEV